MDAQDAVDLTSEALEGLVDPLAAPPETPESEPIPEPVETVLDPTFLNRDFKIRKRKVRLLETETYRKEIGELTPGDQVVVTVQALTSNEYFKAQEEKDQADNWKKLADVFLEKTQSVLPAALKEAMAKAEQATQKEVVFRIELILRGTKKESGMPLFVRSQVVNLAEFFTQDFLRLSNAILDLRGEGPQAGEEPPSFGAVRS